MNDIKNESTHGAPALPVEQGKADALTTARISAYEQKFRDERAERQAAQANSTKVTVAYNRGEVSPEKAAALAKLAKARNREHGRGDVER